MTLKFTEFLQVQIDGESMFERDLFKLSRALGRPAPEFRGARTSAPNGDLCWLIEASIRRDIRSTGSETLTYTLMDVSWADGLCRL